MAGAGAQHGTRLMPIGTHAVDDVVLGAVEIEQNVAGVEAPLPGVEERVVSFAIAQPQKANHGATRELQGGTHLLLSRKGPSAAAVNQTNLIIIARHGGQLSAHGLQGNKESAIHDRDCNIRSGSSPLKPEVSTLQKTGSFYFALIIQFGRLTCSPDCDNSVAEATTGYGSPGKGPSTAKGRSYEFQIESSGLVL